MILILITKILLEVYCEDHQSLANKNGIVKMHLLNHKS